MGLVGGAMASGVDGAGALFELDGRTMGLETLRFCFGGSLLGVRDAPATVWRSVMDVLGAGLGWPLEFAAGGDDGDESTSFNDTFGTAGGVCQGENFMERSADLAG